MFALIIIPICIFFTAYWLHFKITIHPGRLDWLFSNEYLGTLSGSNISNSTQVVYYDSIVNLKNIGEVCYLHSHPYYYAKELFGGRLSSGGQQVTALNVPDKESDWTILSSVATDQNVSRLPVKNGDRIRLKHIATNKYLITHNIPCPVSGSNQEVTAISINDETDPNYNQTLWRIEIKKGQKQLYSGITHFKLIHEATGCLLYTTGDSLPEWANKQIEISAGFFEDDKAWWLVDKVEALYGWNEGDNQKPDEPSSLKTPSFLQKFAEYFRIQLRENSRYMPDDLSESSPIKWPVLIHGHAFWDTEDKTQIIYLLGNPLAWYIALFSLPIFVLMLAIDIIALRRQKQFLNPQQKNFLYEKGCYFFLCYFLNYAPYFLMERILFLHHYLPCYLFSALVFTSVYQILALRYKFLNSLWVIGLICSSIIGFFYAFSCLSYATVQRPEYLKSLKWMEKWDLYRDLQ